jgi:hypothetical protein
VSFRGYLLWDGWVAIVVGTGLFALGLVEGRQGLADAAVSGAILIAGTGVFMRVRHRVPFREPRAWFTAPPLAAAGHDLPICSHRRLLLVLLAQTAAATLVVVGGSLLTGFWLTYMDFAVWAMAVGAIKVGPAAAAIAEHEARHGTSYRVARRPIRGVVALVHAESSAVAEVARPITRS